jgi:hypothetical protein
MAEAQDAKFTFRIKSEVVTVQNAATGQLIARTSTAKLKQAGYNLEKRHLALDAVAAVVAGNGSRDNTVNPGTPVTTLADRDERGEIPLITVEHGLVFVIHHDGTGKDGYTAEVWLLHGPIKKLPQQQRQEQPGASAPLIG